MVLSTKSSKLKYMRPVSRIRIRIHFGWLDPDPHWQHGSGSRRAKMTHKSEENSSFEVLHVLFPRMKNSPVPWTSFMDGGLGLNKLQFLI